MKPIRRLRELATDSPDPLGGYEAQSALSPAASSSRSKTLGPYEESSEPWYRRRPDPNSTSAQHPYQFVHVSLNGEQPGNDVKYEPEAFWTAFWPFVTPDDALISEGAWDDMEGVIAIASSCRLLVARLSDTGGYEELWSYTTPNEGHYHVEWSYDARTLRPIIAIAGSSGVIRIFDYRAKKVIKMLKGHGAHILALKFHPNKPHILATASGDKTIRIWNVLGAELECLPDIDYSENYPQGDADEGTIAIGILAGEQLGHRADVSTIAFHPWHDAIASGGYDRQVKIWPLPPLPPATNVCPARITKKGHRPVIIHEPLFSTDTIHQGPLDCIDWLSSDVILSRANTETIAWQWTAYPLYFDKDQAAPKNRTPPIQHSRDSLAYQVCMDFDQTSDDMFWRIGVHLGFPETEDERDFAGVDRNTFVTDTLIAFPVKGHQKNSKTSKSHGHEHDHGHEKIKIRMINPSIWRHTEERPPERNYERPTTPDDWGDSGSPSPDKPGDEGFPIVMVDGGDSDESEADEEVEGIETVEDSEDSADRGDNGDNEDSTESDIESLGSLDGDSTDTPPPGGDMNMKGEPDDDNRIHRDTRTPKQNQQRNRNQEKTVKPVPWHLIVPPKAWEKAVDKTRFNAMGKRILKANDELFRAVAISPRGAKWVVAVGHAEAIAVWRLPPPPM